MFSGVGTENKKSEGYLDQLYKYDFITSKWTLVSGNHETNQAGTYTSIGSKGYPGGRYGASSWVDRSGNLWMFGGMGVGNKQGLEGPLSDLWKYSPATNTWIFVAGSAEVSAETTSDAPSARAGAVSWTDENGNLYLFGGKAGSEYLNDLWTFSTSTKTWTNVQKSVAPKARAFSQSWVDATGAAWVYGGQSRSAVLSDLWQFKNNQWTLVYINGTDSNQNAVFPIIGGHGSPGGVHSAASWVYQNGLYMFGGKSVRDGKQVLSNNIWKFDIATNTWQYVSGTATLAAGSLSAPGARFSAVASINKYGNLAVFGGNGFDYPVVAAHILGDTWTIPASSFEVKVYARAAAHDVRATNTTSSTGTLTSGSTSGSSSTGSSSSSTGSSSSTTEKPTGTTSASSSTGSSSSSTGSSSSTTEKPTGTTSASSSTSGSTSGTTSTTSSTPTPTPAPTTTTAATVTLNLAMSGDPTAVNTSALGTGVASSLGVDPSTVNVTIVLDGKRAVAFHIIITVFFPNSSAIAAIAGSGTTGGSGAPNITAQLQVLKAAVTTAANSSAVQNVIASSGSTVTGITTTTSTEQVPVSTQAPTSAPTTTTTNKNSPANNVVPSFLFAVFAVFACAYFL